MIVKVEDLDAHSRDAGVAAHHGDPLREQRTLATSVGLVDRSNRRVLAVPGDERLGWLHSLASQHLLTLSGSGTETLFLSPHGHVEHHAVAYDDGGTTWLDLEPWDDLLAYLARMVFMSRVAPRLDQDLAVYSLVGPHADEVLPLGPADVLPVPVAKFPTGAVPPRPTAVYPAAPLPEGGFARRMPYGVDLLVPRAAVDGLVKRLDVPWAGLWAFEALRVADRRPRLGFETDHRTLPAEAGWLATGVHLDKGCYRGQETVARVHHLGRPPRRLVLLHLDGSSDTPPEPGAPVVLDGREVGFLGTAAQHHELGMIALAVVKRSVPDDARLSVAGSAAAIDPADPG